MPGETCGICGGDGRIGNAFGGSHTTCPGCHGSGKKADDDHLFHDVTKTKPSHYRQANKAEVVVKQTWPTTYEGIQLATEVRDCKTISVDTKTRLTREIMDYEGSHGKCTQTFVKKVRKQIRPAT
ncbi:MAG: molecular chaperone DnaJ [Byssovorax sp.]